MDRDSKFVLRRIIIDFVVLLSIGFPILIFFLWGKPYQRGFFCNDESLSHPFKDSTVTNTMLYIVGLVLPLLVIVITEFVICRQCPGQVAHTFIGRTIPPWVWEAYKVIGVFGFGAASSQLTTDIAKYTIGRLRPHFFDVCGPNIDCNLPANRHKYFTDFQCTKNEGTRLLKDVRLSFPSGHSSFSAYTMLFVAMYLQSRMTWKGSKLLRHAIQYFCLMLCWFTAMSRISNYKHHWSDVLSGLLLGFIVSILTVVYVSDLFPRTAESSEKMSRQGKRRDEQALQPMYQVSGTQQNTASPHTTYQSISDYNGSRTPQRPHSPSHIPVGKSDPTV